MRPGSGNGWMHASTRCTRVTHINRRLVAVALRQVPSVAQRVVIVHAASVWMEQEVHVAVVDRLPAPCPRLVDHGKRNEKGALRQISPGIVTDNARIWPCRSSRRGACYFLTQCSAASQGTETRVGCSPVCFLEVQSQFAGPCFLHCVFERTYILVRKTTKIGTKRAQIAR